MGDFIGKYIFPGGELLHTSLLLREMAASGLGMVDTENLRPHHARTLWVWSDALESRLEAALEVLNRTHGPSGGSKVLRAYRLYLAGCAMTFEHGWNSLHQFLATRPDGDMPHRHAAQRPVGLSVQPRVHVPLMLYKFKSKAAGDLIMLEPNGRRVLQIIGKDPGPKGIILPQEMPAAAKALEAAIAREEAEQKAAIEDAKARGEDPPRFEAVSLRQRAVPFLDMLRRCSQADKEIVWGV